MAAILRVSAVCMLALISLGGCKVAVIVGEGGGVTSTEEGTCFHNTACVHDVTDTSYTASFTASTLPGWHFVRWESGDNFICGGSTLEKCTVDNTVGAGNPDVEAVVASNATFYLMPVFTDELPIGNTILADGKEWAPIHILRTVSWNQVNAVCPITSAGVCDGSLLGYNLDGWTWANVDDINSLLNSYIGSPALGPGPDLHIAGFNTVHPLMIADGWGITLTDPQNGNSTSGLIAAESVPGVSGRIGGIAGVINPTLQFDLATTSLGEVAVNDVSSTIGVYLYRTP